MTMNLIDVESVHSSEGLSARPTNIKDFSSSVIEPEISSDTKELGKKLSMEIKTSPK